MDDLWRPCAKKASHKLTRLPDFEEQATKLLSVFGRRRVPGKKMGRRKKGDDTTEDNVMTTEYYRNTTDV